MTDLQTAITEATAVGDPKRLVMLKVLSYYLSMEVTTGNGYKHTLTDAVFRGRMNFTTDDALPMISILDNPDPDRYPTPAGNRGYELATGNEDYVLLLQGWAKDDKINPTDPAHVLMADVRKALAKIAYRGEPDSAPVTEGYPYLLGGLITRLSIEPGVVRPPTEQASADAFFWMRISVGFTEDPNDPYDLS